MHTHTQTIISPPSKDRVNDWYHTTYGYSWTIIPEMGLRLKGARKLLLVFIMLIGIQSTLSTMIIDKNYSMIQKHSTLFT